MKRIDMVVALTLFFGCIALVGARPPFGMHIRPEIYLDLTQEDDYEPEPLPWPMRVTITAYDQSTGLQVAGPVETVSSEEIITLRYTETSTTPAPPPEEGSDEPAPPASVSVSRLEVFILVDPVMGSSVDLRCVVEALVVEQGRQREMKTTTTVPCRVGQESPLATMGSLEVKVKVEWVDR
ncbi:MAG: hypothetical protein EOM20_17945 [Spartobacteria bacterium]|nr:hypothetical protein [Spartobacteria bacterium]